MATISGRTFVITKEGNSYRGQRNGFSTGEVAETQTNLASTKAHTNAIAEGKITGVSRFFAVSNRSGISPTTDPFGKSSHNSGN